MPDSFCLLCQSRLFQKSQVVRGRLLFCCQGCAAVYSILEAQNGLENAREHPLFIQALRAGVIANTQLNEQLLADETRTSYPEKKKLHLEILGMWCSSCALLIRWMLLRQKGVVSAVIDYATDLAVIEYCPRSVSKDELFSLIHSLGYNALDLDREGKDPHTFQTVLRLGVALFCSLNIMMFSYPLYATYFDFDDTGAGPLFAWLSLLFFPFLFLRIVPGPSFANVGSPVN